MKAPLGEELLFGALENGGHVVIDAAEGALRFDFQKARPAVETSALN